VRERGKGEVGRRVKLGRASLVGRLERRKERGGVGPWAGWGRERGLGFVFFLFFKSFLNNFSNPFLNQTFYTFFITFFHKLFLKTFKATQQQTHAFQHDAQTLGYYLN
jgi:hypothetical protein